MIPALLLIDLQHDFLREPGLEPAAGTLVDQAARLLELARRTGTTVVHVHTLLDSPEDAMPHWRTSGRIRCLRGTEGSLPPPALEPGPDELVFAKTRFSAFTHPDLLSCLRDRGIDTLILAGVHLHACIRAAATDAYQLGFTVWIAADAVGTYDPQHGEHSRLHLEGRAATFLDTATIEQQLRNPGSVAAPASHSIPLVEPRRRTSNLGSIAVADSRSIEHAIRRAHIAARAWPNTTMPTRIRLVRELARQIRVEGVPLADQVMRNVGKPITQARAEVSFAVELLEAAAHLAESMEPGFGGHGPGWKTRALPHGVVAVITPWNNPLAIPLGKIAPALLYGNTVVWKPAPAGTLLAHHLIRALDEAGFPPDSVQLLTGDRSTAESLLGHSGVDAATITGSSLAGHTAQVL